MIEENLQKQEEITEQHNDKVNTIEDELKSATNAFIPGLGSLASNFIDGSISDDNVKNMWTDYVKEGSVVLSQPEGYITLK